jgi:PTH1 family peptidyl-tRNA hydrolase
MPATFMNNSGVAVSKIAVKKGIAPADILVICDDLSLIFGSMRLRPSGMAGGHNGLKSIIEHLGSNAFARLRLGVSRPKPGIDTADYVLANFTAGEKEALPDFINKALGCCHSWVVNGVEDAMNQFNQRKSNE